MVKRRRRSSSPTAPPTPEWISLSGNEAPLSAAKLSGRCGALGVFPGS